MRKNRLFSSPLALLLAAAMLLTAFPAPAEQAQAALTPGRWSCADGSSITFSEDGTGKYLNKNGKEFDIAWSLDGQTLSFTYDFYGERTETLDLSADGRTLASPDGGRVYVSDQKEDSAEDASSAAWSCGDGSSIAFSSDGTGRFVNKNGKEFDITWTEDGQTLTFTYDFYGKKSQTLVRSADGQTLASPDGSLVYVRGGEAAGKELPGYLLALGEEIDLGFVRINLKEVKVLSEVKPASVGIVWPERTGKKYLCLLGEVTNTGPVTLKLDNLSAEFRTDRYHFPAKFLGMYDDLSKNTVDPAATAQLYMGAEVPDGVLEQLNACDVLLAVNEDAARVSELERADFVFRFHLNADALMKARADRQEKQEKKEDVFFNESPALPQPGRYLDVKELWRRDEATTHKPNRVEYTFKSVADEVTAEQALNEYRRGLEQDGYGIRDEKDRFVVYSGKTMLAEVEADDFNWFKVRVATGNERFTQRPAPGTTPDPEDMKLPELKVGDVIRLPGATFTLEKTGSAQNLYSCISTSTADKWRYYYAESGETLVYLQGTFKNTGSSPADIRHIFGELILDDQYHYHLDSDGARSGAQSFINTVNPGVSVTLYIFANVPKDMWNRSATCLFKLGFTDNYRPEVVRNELPDFDYCDDVFYVRADAHGASGSKAAATPKPTATPKKSGFSFGSGGSSSEKSKAAPKATATPKPNKAKLPVLMSGLEFGDDMATVRKKLSADGVNVTQGTTSQVDQNMTIVTKEANNFLRADSDMFALPEKNYQFRFTDKGKLYLISNQNILNEKVSAKQAESIYQKVLDQLTKIYGKPNGRGSTKKRGSLAEDMAQSLSSLPGVYGKTVRRAEWYIKSTPYPVKIDLIYGTLGNTIAGTSGVILELYFEASGV